MKNKFYLSDLHLGHKNIIEYERTQFSCLDEMHQYIEEQWNKTVNTGDRVYIVGDVAWKKEYLPILDRLKGKKVLVKGNHDNHIKPIEYLKYFDDIRGAMTVTLPGVEGKVLVQHIPCHPSQFDDRYVANIHGHGHSKFVKDTNLKVDTRYINVCCEVLNYKPIHENLISVLCNTLKVK